MHILRGIWNWFLGILGEMETHNSPSGSEFTRPFLIVESHGFPPISGDPLSRPDLFYLVGDIVMPRPDADPEKMVEWHREHPSTVYTGTGGCIRDIPACSGHPTNKS